MRVRNSCRGVLALIACSVASVTLAEDFFAEALAVAPSVLDQVRGGLELPDSLRASMTIERTAHVNGELVAQLSVKIPDIAHMTEAQASKLAEAAGILVIQNGPANAFNMADLGPASTVIQNTLNDQHLVALTTISVQVNTLGAFQEMNFHDGLAQALGNVTGVR